MGRQKMKAIWDPRHLQGYLKLCLCQLSVPSRGFTAAFTPANIMLLSWSWAWWRFERCFSERRKIMPGTEAVLG